MIYSASPEQVQDLIESEAMPWVKASRPLLVGVYQGERVCIFGVVPASMLDDSAYLWLWTRPEVPKIAFGRHARRVMPRLLELYPRLICNCFNQSSAKWITTLGARSIGKDLYEFRRQ